MLPYIVAMLWSVTLCDLVRARVELAYKFDARWISGAYVFIGFLACAPIIFLLAFRSGVGTDFDAYVGIYERIREGASGLRYEPLYTLLNLWSSLLGDYGLVLMFGMAAAFAALPVMWRILQSSCMPWLSVIILFGMTFPFALSNWVRFMVAVGVMFYVLPAIWKRKPVVWMAGAVVSAGFHYTALFLLPLYWGLRCNWGVVTAFFFLFLASLISINKSIALYLLNKAEFLFPSNYAHYPGEVAGQINNFEFGFGYFWYIFSALLVISLWRGTGKLGDVAVVIRNSFFLGLVVMIGTYQFWAVNRLAWYFYISGALYWPLVITHILGRGRSIFVFGVTAIHLVLFVHALLIGSHDAIPYRSIL